ncbi:MAG: hypothetical protein AAF675_18815, partial [Pseudomonadota bacterium]
GGLSPGAPGISGQLMADVLIEFMGPDANEPFLADFANRIRSRSPASAALLRQRLEPGPGPGDGGPGDLGNG